MYYMYYLRNEGRDRTSLDDQERGMKVCGDDSTSGFTRSLVSYLKISLARDAFQHTVEVLQPIEHDLYADADHDEGRQPDENAGTGRT